LKIDMFTPVSRAVKRLGSKLILALVLSCATLLVGFYLGRHTANKEVQVSPEAFRVAQSQLSDMRDALDVTLGELQVQRTRHEVDSRALELVRSEMAAEKVRTAELEEGLSFYRSMVVSDDPAKGLNLHQPELVPGDSKERFSYRIFVQQREREYEMVEGALSVVVFGIKGEEEVSYPLAELSEGYVEDAAALHFRYFQAIEGELVLPEGFVPTGVILVARTSKPRETEIREQFPWELQERFINVGQ
jgi:hypothetical protein